MGILSLAPKWGARDGAQECLEGVFEKSMLEFPLLTHMLAQASLSSRPPGRPGLGLFSSWNLSEELAFRAMASSSRSLSPGGSAERGEEARHRLSAPNRA